MPRMLARARLSARDVVIAAVLGAGVHLVGADQKFYDDDPLAVEPETQDARGVQPWDVILSFDLLHNLFGAPGDRRPIRAMNVNSVDEVPDSNWFTNRVLSRPYSIEEAVVGPQSGPGPAVDHFTLTRRKSSGVTPGFQARDAAGADWFVQFDAPDYPEAASAASVVANKLFHALGYWQSENYVAEIHPENITISPQATFRPQSGRDRPYTRADLDEVLSRSARLPNGAYRMLASRSLVGPGRTALGGFKYHGTRPDDPNDIVPHEHRRELRALQVFGAWTNLVDMKAGNTLDMLIDETDRSVVRHYLQDVGSTFGTGALGPREWWEGHEYLFEGTPTWKRLVSFGFYLKPWQTMPYEEDRSVGRFEGEQFDPASWKPRVPNAAILNVRADDQFWAARRVMAFSDEMIRAIVATGEFSDPAAERHLADVLIRRRDKIGQVYLTAINPIVNPALGADGVLTFGNAAVEGRVASPPARYQSVWFDFDNVTRESRRIAEVSSAAPRLASPASLPSDVGHFIRVDISAESDAHPSWAMPVHAYFKRTAEAWRLVGLERMD